MKRILLLVGTLTATLFSANMMAGDKEPNSGRFDFQVRKPKTNFDDRLIPLVIRIGDNIPEGQGVGLNVYWKTKYKNQAQGRSYHPSPLLPNLPAARKNFEELNYHIDTDPSTPVAWGNSEHIEWKVWEAWGPKRLFNNSCAPTLGVTKTRFYNHRYPKGYVLHRAPNDPCNLKTRFGQDTLDGTDPSIPPFQHSEDKDVAMTSVAFITSDTKENKCGNLGEYCGGTGHGSERVIFIPSNQLEFLVIEIIGFRYYTGALLKVDETYFYTFPQSVLTFIPAVPKNAKPNTIYMSVTDATGKKVETISNTDSEPDAGDFTDFESSPEFPSHGEIKTIDPSGQYNFTDLDYMDLSLRFYMSGVGYKSGKGVSYTLTPHNLKPECINGNPKVCEYATPANP